MNLPYTTLKIKNDEYKLKITAKAAIELEKKQDKSIVDGMSDFDKVGTLTDYLEAGLQAYNPGITEDSAIEIFDDYISAGGDVGSFAEVLVEMLIVSGFLKRPQTEALMAQVKQIQESVIKTPEK